MLSFPHTHIEVNTFKKTCTELLFGIVNKKPLDAVVHAQFRILTPNPPQTCLHVYRGHFDTSYGYISFPKDILVNLKPGRYSFEVEVVIADYVETVTLKTERRFTITKQVPIEVTE